MFNKILIANRGEIACRVIRSARRLGIGTVAVYSDADRDALHVTLADEAVRIGAAAPRDSYLRADRIVQAALATGAAAIHPGYGFLAENADFARLCAGSGVVFIGPPPEAIAAMGCKSAAKRLMEQASVPLVPGYHGEAQDDELLAAEAARIGFPVLLKAAAGGGGKGMRRVDRAEEFAAALAAARREADKAFGDARMLVEKCLLHPRHVEVQVFCDTHGNAVHLFERDCSLQRRHQKVIEEAPAPGITPALREALGHAALRAAAAIGYVGAGTVEFLLDADGEFYFMEMNTRLQVEHPVTEMITGEDLVEWQLRVAAGEPLPRRQDELAIRGHAVEARVYAEDPHHDFLPVSGTLAFLQAPLEGPQLRIDTGVVQGDAIGIHYDPLIAKLIVRDQTRERALARLAAALGDYRVGGLVTNLTLLHRLATHPAFVRGEFDTGFIATHAPGLLAPRPVAAARELALAVLYLLLARERDAPHPAAGDPHSPWRLANGWRSAEAAVHRLELRLDAEARRVVVEEVGNGSARRFRLHSEGHAMLLAGRLAGNRLEAVIDGHRSSVTVFAGTHGCTLFDGPRICEFALQRPDTGEDADAAAADAFAAPMNGAVVAWLVEPGQAVERGDGLLVIEAMKMEHVVRAPLAGRVTAFRYRPGELVDGGAELLGFEPA
ncbi:MAG: Acetyl-/propionyl-coenzyme A carboxylase alpha chain [Pseudomonadales bacterium]|nr:Acetyl-/propionyl-coenzyme A carboxylase alpha chain [Pseudomonadales bacterium]